MPFSQLYNNYHNLGVVGNSATSNMNQNIFQPQKTEPIGTDNSILLSNKVNKNINPYPPAQATHTTHTAHTALTTAQLQK